MRGVFGHAGQAGTCSSRALEPSHRRENRTCRAGSRRGAMPSRSLSHCIFPSSKALPVVSRGRVPDDGVASRGHHDAGFGRADFPSPTGTFPHWPKGAQNRETRLLEMQLIPRALTRSSAEPVGMPEIQAFWITAVSVFSASRGKRPGQLSNGIARSGTAHWVLDRPLSWPEHPHRRHHQRHNRCAQFAKRRGGFDSRLVRPCFWSRPRQWGPTLPARRSRKIRVQHSYFSNPMICSSVNR